MQQKKRIKPNQEGTFDVETVEQESEFEEIITRKKNLTPQEVAVIVHQDIALIDGAITALQERILELKEQKRKIRKNAEDSGIVL